MAQDDFKSEYLEEIKRKIIFSIEEFHPSTAPPPSHHGYRTEYGMCPKCNGEGWVVTHWQPLPNPPITNKQIKK